MPYDNKITCFVDILGFKNLIHTKSKEEIDKILDIIAAECKKQEGFKVGNERSNLVLSQFSDSIILTFESSHLSTVNFNFLKKLCVLLIQKHGIVLRGGITYGEVTHSAERVFGPTFNEAYYIESKSSKYPRIVFSENFIKIPLRPDNNDDRNLLEFLKPNVCKIDDDGFYYIDYFEQLSFILKTENEQIDYYRKLKKVIESGLLNSCLSVREKYNWMKVKFNVAVASNFPELTV